MWAQLPLPTFPAGAYAAAGGFLAFVVVACWLVVWLVRANERRALQNDVRRDTNADEFVAQQHQLMARMTADVDEAQAQAQAAYQRERDTVRDCYERLEAVRQEAAERIEAARAAHDAELREWTDQRLTLERALERCRSSHPQ